MQYYFFATLLPPLSLDVEVELDLDEFEHLAAYYLSKKDQQALRFIRIFFDLHNMRAFWMVNREIHSWGNLNERQLEEAILTRGFEDAFINEYLEKYESDSDRIAHFSSLLHTYYGIMEQTFNGSLLGNYAAFNDELRISLLVLRAKRCNLGLVDVMIDDVDHPLVQAILEKKGEEIPLPSFCLPWVDIYEKHRNDPLDLEKSFLQLRFDYVEDVIKFDLFSSERIIGYFIQLSIVTSWKYLIEKNEENSKEERKWLQSILQS